MIILLLHSLMLVLPVNKAGPCTDTPLIAAAKQAMIILLLYSLVLVLMSMKLMVGTIPAYSSCLGRP